MIAAHTFYSYIHSHTNDFPAILPAWVWLFHLHDIVQSELFLTHITCPLCSKSVIRLSLPVQLVYCPHHAYTSQDEVMGYQYPRYTTAL